MAGMKGLFSRGNMQLKTGNRGTTAERLNV